MDTEDKRIIVGTSRVYLPNQVPHYDAVGVDFAAAIRMFVGGAPATMTPTHAVERMMHHVHPFLASAKILIMAMDRPNRIPTRRSVHNTAKARPRTTPPISKAGAATITASHMPAPWEDVLCAPHGKQQVWRVCADILVDYLGETYPEIASIVYTNDDDDILVGHALFPRAPHTTCGEGEMMACDLLEACKDMYPDMVKTTVIVTNDIDPVCIQTMRDQNHDISLGSPYVFKTIAAGTTYTPAVCKSKKRYHTRENQPRVARGYEIMVPVPVSADFMERLHYYALVMLMSTTDYCSGILKFGWTQPTASRVLKHEWASLIATPWFSLAKGEETRLLWFDPVAFLRLLRKLAMSEAGPRRASAPKVDCIAKFTRMVHDHVWTTAYWAGMCSGLPRGGPPLPDYDVRIFPDEYDTVTELIGADPDDAGFDERQFVPVIYDEEDILSSCE